MRFRFQISPAPLGVLLGLVGVLPDSSSGQTVDRYAHSTTLLADGNVLIVGGLAAPGTLVPAASSVERYSPTAAVISASAPSGCGSSLERSSHTATLLPNGKVLIAGGVGPGPAALDTAVLYSPASHACEAFAAMATARFHHTATLLSDGRALLAGGQTDIAGTVTNAAEAFDPASGAFSAVGAMTAPRAAQSAALLYNAQVFVAGGYGPAGAVTNTTERFDPVSNTWAPGPGLISARSFHASTVLGNRFVLLSGGFNGLNEKERLGILDTAEVYNPVSNAMMPPPAPLQARKMQQTAVLEPDGRVSLFGGLGNITTTYLAAGSIPFEPGSFLSVSSSAAGSVAPSTGNILAASELRLKLNATLSVPVTGDIVKGQVYFYTPTRRGAPSLALPDADVIFLTSDKVPPPEYPAASQFAKLDGTYVTVDERLNGGKIVDRAITILPPSGIVAFKPQTAASKNGISAAGSSAAFAPTPCPSGDTCALTGGTLTVDIDVPFPTTDLGGTVLAGSATILAGSIFNAQRGFNLTLSGGLTLSGSNFDGGQVVSDGLGKAHYVRSVTFSNLSGTVTNSTTTPIASPLDISGQSVTGLQLWMRYIVSPISLTDYAFAYSAATITIRSMVFGDQELYDPSKNAWKFNDSRATPRFNHSVVLTPDGDSVHFGGRRCDNAAAPSGTCAALTSLGGPGGYFPIPQAFSPDAPLNAARGNHTTTALPDGRVLVAGGTDGPSVLNSAELYDPLARSWSKTGSLRSPRAGHTATLLPNGTVLVAGGYADASSTGAVRSAEIYYPDSGRWLPTGVMTSSRQAHAAVLLPDGNVLAAGGYANGAYLSAAELFYSTAAAWRSAGSMTLAAGRADYSATLLKDGRVLTVGGINAGGVTRGVETYDPASNAWSARTSMPNTIGRGDNGRFAHTATLLLPGLVFVAGGDDGLGEILSPLLYDPGSDSWQPVDVVPDPEKPGLVIGEDVAIGRLRHTAVLSPDGRVLLIGGVTASGSSLDSIEAFNMQDGIWTTKKEALPSRRAYHGSVLLADGRILNTGGADAPGSYLSRCDGRYYGPERDAATPASSPPFSRVPAIVSIDTGAFDRGASITLSGTNFKGVSEASGGGAASQDSSFHTPRVYLQALDAPSGFLLDLSTALYANPAGAWGKTDSSITFSVPAGSASLPYGWHRLRVAANAQFSDAITVQAGPPKPSGTPGVPTGVMLDPANVLWTWTAAPGCPAPSVCEGYHVYSSTDGVFLSTLSAVCPSGTCQFLQAGLGPAVVASLKVAAYNLSGDGPPATATNPFVTPSLDVTGVTGLAVGTGSIVWSWSNVSAATSYNVYGASTGFLIATAPNNAFTQAGLSTNTAHAISVQAANAFAGGPLTPSATVHTLAWPPIAAAASLTSLSTGGFRTFWQSNTNPAGTLYAVALASVPNGPPVSVSTATPLNFTVAGRTPNTFSEVRVRAVNGDGIPTPYVLIAGTYTLANTPANAAVTANTASLLELAWNANSNPAYTAYQVLVSSDGFQSAVSTPIPFSANHTAVSAGLSGLFTGALYTIYVVARNQDGVETSPAILSTVTFNGGAPAGSLAVKIDPDSAVTLGGTIGSGRSVYVRVPPRAFPVPVTLFVSSRAAVAACANPGGLNAAFSITVVPEMEPVFPVDIGLSYAGADPVGNGNTLAIVRFDPVSGACVPLRSRIEPAQGMVLAQTNHLSDFQLAQWGPSSGVSGLRVFPNPLRTRGQSFLTFDRMPAEARVRIYTLKGEEVFDAAANGSGLLTWNATNKAHRPVGSGLYLAVVEAGGERRVVKVAVIR